MEIRRDVYQAIADPTRRAILGLLATQPLTPRSIIERFDSKRQTISKHIQILYECELLKQSQSGKALFYHLNPYKMKEVADWIEPYRKLWENRFNEMENILIEMQGKKNNSKGKTTKKK